MLKKSWRQLLSISFLVSFLLVIGNIFVGAVQVSQRHADTIQQKLGYNIYIRNDGSDTTTPLAAVNMLRDLKDSGLRPTFIPKKTGKTSLGNMLSGAMSTLEASNIQNPLPDRIIVVLKNQTELNKVGTIIETYKEDVLNYDTIMSDVGLRFVDTTKQRNVIGSALNRSNANIVIASILVVMLALVIIAFVVLIIDVTFRQFAQQVEVEKLVGASYSRIMAPFVLKIVVMLSLAFGLCALYIAIGGAYYHDWLMETYNINLYAFFSSSLIMIEVGVLLVFGMIVSMLTTYRLIRSI